MSSLRSFSLLLGAAVLIAACQSASGETTAPATFAPMSTTSTTGGSTATTVPEASPSVSTAPPTPTTTTSTTAPVPECTVRGIGTEDDFYRTTCEQTDIEIVAGGDIEAAALEAAADRMNALLTNRPDFAAAVAASIEHVAIMGRDQRITSLPDFEDLYSIHPGTNWARLGRSFPGTEEIPVPAGAEENLLCLESDRYEGEDMFIRDFGWTIRRFGIAPTDPSLDRAIEDAYGRAIAADLWQNTVAEVNSDMYWAEGVQSFFDANNEETGEKDQIHNQIDTRDELRAYDPTLYRLLVDVFGESDWRPVCPASG